MLGLRLMRYFLRSFFVIKNNLFTHHNYFHFLKNCWKQTLPSASTYWKACDFLVVDLEMSSLDVNSGEILSIGWVTVTNGKIQLKSAEHHVIHSNNGVGQSATIHQLRDCEVKQGLSITQISARFLQMAAGKTLVFHHASLDMAFLNKASMEINGAPLLLPISDTLILEKEKLIRKHTHIPQGELRLATCRDRYNLPLYPAHNALVDAIATAELFIAIATHKGSDTKLKDLM